MRVVNGFLLRFYERFTGSMSQIERHDANEFQVMAILSRVFVNSVYGPDRVQIGSREES